MHKYNNGTDATSGPNIDNHYYDRAGVKAATADLIYGQFADRRNMPTKLGKTYKVSMYEHILDGDGVTDAGLDADGNASNGNLYGRSRDIGDITAGLPVLGEGASDVNRVVVTKKDGEVKLNRFGLFLEYTDEATLFLNDDVQMEYREKLGEAAKEVNEDLLQKDLLSGANVYYIGSATARTEVGVDVEDADGADDDNARVGYNDVRKWIATLVSNRAKKFTTVISGSVNVDTKTVGASYVGIIGPEVKFDLQTVADPFGKKAWTPYQQYASAGTIMNHEVGAIEEMRFIESERAQMWAGGGAAVPADYSGDLANDGTNFNVYPVLMPTQGAFATIGLQGRGKMNFKAKKPGKASDTDKFGVKGFFSVNWFYAGMILDQSKLLRAEVCATDIGIGNYGSGAPVNYSGPATMSDVTEA